MKVDARKVIGDAVLQLITIILLIFVLCTHATLYVAAESMDTKLDMLANDLVQPPGKSYLALWAEKCSTYAWQPCKE